MADCEGCTPLAIAIREESEEMFELLQRNGASIKASLHDGSNLLHFAIEISSESMVKMLLKKGADLFALNGTGSSALELANLRGNKAIFKYLNEYVAVKSGKASWG